MNFEYTLKSFRMQKCYIYFLFCQLAVISTLVIYELISMGGHANHFVTFVIEFIIGFAFIMEVLIRLSYNRADFFKHLNNIFDFIIISVLISQFVITVAYEAHLCDYKPSQLLPVLFLIARYITQIARILSTIRSINDIKKAANIELTFEEYEDEDDDLLTVDPTDIAVMY